MFLLIIHLLIMYLLITRSSISNVPENVREFSFISDLFTVVLHFEAEYIRTEGNREQRNQGISTY
jgi:hypothetical protein